MTRKTLQLKKFKNHWPALADIITVIESEGQYQKAVQVLDSLVDEIGEDENHALTPMMEVLAVLIEHYEADHLPEPKQDPVEVLKFLMQEHGLNQSDLKEIGSQGVVSEILNGKRKLNLRQIKSLTERFGVSPQVFMN